MLRAMGSCKPGTHGMTEGMCDSFCPASCRRGVSETVPPGRLRACRMAGDMVAMAAGGSTHSLTMGVFGVFGVGTDAQPLPKANVEATSRLKQYLGDAVGWAKGGSTRFIGSSGRGTLAPESNAMEAVGAVVVFTISNSPRGPGGNGVVPAEAPPTRGDQLCREGSAVHVEAAVRFTGDTRGDQVCRDMLQAGLPAPGASNVDAVANSFEASDEVSTFSTSASDACNGTRTCP